MAGSGVRWVAGEVGGVLAGVLSPAAQRLEPKLMPRMSKKGRPRLIFTEGNVPAWSKPSKRRSSWRGKTTAD